jgi:PTS system fructose-specific IIC component
MANFLKCLQTSRVITRLKAKKKADAIREIGSLFEEGPEVSDLRSFLSKLFQREANFTSSVEHGVVLPHYSDKSINIPIVGLGISEKGIDWGEDEAAHIVILVGWPDRHDQAYLQMVAEIASLFRKESIREGLLAATSAEEVVSVLKSGGTPVKTAS